MGLLIFFFGESEQFSLKYTIFNHQKIKKNTRKRDPLQLISLSLGGLFVIAQMC